MDQMHHPLFRIRTIIERHVKPFTLFSYPRYALLGSQGSTITLAHPDEPYIQKYGRFGEVPVPLSRTRLVDAALRNPLPQLYLARPRSLRIRKPLTETGRRETGYRKPQRREKVQKPRRHVL